MAVTRDSRHIRMTAGGDAATGKFCLTGLFIILTGGTIGQAFKVSDTDGNIIAEGYVEAATQNIDLLGGIEIHVDGIVWTTAPAAGSPVLLARYR